MTFYVVEVTNAKTNSPTPSYKLKATYYNSIYVYGIKYMTFQVYIKEVDASDLVKRGGNTHVNICWTLQIILKTF